MFSTRVLVLLIGVSSSKGWWLFSKRDKTTTEDDKICKARPQTDNELNVEFLLFTRFNPTTLQDVTDGSLLESNFDPKKDTKFLIHGYNHKEGLHQWVVDMTAEMLKYHDVNVIAVNWKNGADSLYYGQSAANTRRVGKIIGDFIRWAFDVTGASYDSHHLIGHSLGAHVSGFAGASLDGQIGRITGLDPAGPCFHYADAIDRLSPDDALFVDTIHTDGDNLLQAGFGTELPMGDVDFYPNGGEEQPGCDSKTWQHFIDLVTAGTSGLQDSVLCNHRRAAELFQESFNPEHKFTAYPCDHHDDYEKCTQCGFRGCSRMGYEADRNRHGIYTLTTRGSSPFSF